MNSSVLEHRRYHVSALLGHCVVFFSGEGDDGNLYSLRSLCLYNPYTDRCLHYEITGEMEVPTKRVHACAVNIGKDIFMFGGSNATGITKDLNDVWKLSFDDDPEKRHDLKWEELKVEPASATPSARSDHSGWEYNDLLWTFGGWGFTPEELSQQCLHEYGEFNDEGQNNQLLSFDPSIKQWMNHESRGATPCPRMGAAAAVLGDAVWLYGGAESLSFTPPLDDLYQLDMNSLTWTQIQMLGTPAPFLEDHTLNLLSEQSLLLCGGENVIVLKVLAPDTVELSELTLIPNRCRRKTSHTATTIRGNTVVIYGGYINVNCIPTNDVFVLFRNRMTLMQLATRTLYRHLDKFAWEDIPVTIRKLLFSPVTVQGE